MSAFTSSVEGDRVDLSVATVNEGLSWRWGADSGKGQRKPSRGGSGQSLRQPFGMF